jgi:Asp/Glu/hydantoin racemase
MIPAVVMIEVEHVEQVANGRHVARDIGVITILYRIGKIIAASVAEFGIEHPVPFDEFHERGVLIVAVTDMRVAFSV